jgi:hypothetical protein
MPLQAAEHIIRTFTYTPILVTLYLYERGDSRITHIKEVGFYIRSKGLIIHGIE